MNPELQLDCLALLDDGDLALHQRVAALAAERHCQLRLLDPARSESDRAGLSREDQAPQRSKRRPRLEPQLLILSSGELSPFTLRLSERRADGNAWRLSSDGLRLPQAEPLESRR